MSNCGHVLYKKSAWPAKNFPAGHSIYSKMIIVDDLNFGSGLIDEMLHHRFGKL